MEKYIKKSALVEWIKKEDKDIQPNKDWHFDEYTEGYVDALAKILSFIDTLETKDPYEQCIQYSSVKDGIKAHAETYSFNIESQLFNQLTKEQQSLWRKEIEQAVISGGEAGVELAEDIRYNKKVDFEKEIKDWMKTGPHTSCPWCTIPDSIKITAEHFYKLGLKAAQEGE